MYNITNLSNSIKVATHAMPGVNSVSIGIWVGAGGRYESKQLSGISHFTEHLVFKGTKYRTCRQIKESIEGIGGSLNGFTSEYVTCFLARVLAKYSKLALDVLLDMVLNPQFAKRNIDKERLVIFEEIRMYFDLPNHVAYNELNKLLWPDQPLGRNLTGTIESLKYISRNNLIDYNKRHYTSNNIIITAAGKIKHERFVKVTEGILLKYRCKKSSRQKPQYEKAVVLQKKPIVKFINRDTEQMHMFLGLHTFEREHSLKHALSLLHIVLGANMSSRLFNEVREKKGLAYEIATALRRYNDTGAFIVHGGIVNKKLEEAIRVIFHQLRESCRNFITSDEFKRAKEYYIGHLMIGLEDATEQMLWMGDSLFVTGKIKTSTQIIREIKKVRIQDLKKAAQLIFKKTSLNGTIVGPLKKINQGKIEKIFNSFGV